MDNRRESVTGWLARAVDKWGREDPMAREPMTQNQKFTLLVFALVLLVAVVVVYLVIQGGLDSMI